MAALLCTSQDRRMQQVRMGAPRASLRHATTRSALPVACLSLVDRHYHAVRCGCVAVYAPGWSAHTGARGHYVSSAATQRHRQRCEVADARPRIIVLSLFVFVRSTVRVL